MAEATAATADTNAATTKTADAGAANAATTQQNAQTAQTAGATAQVATSKTNGADGAAAASTVADEPPKGVWPDDWVTRMAKGDEKRVSDLKRYQSPEAVADAYASLRRKLDSGEFKSALPKDATDDDLKAWRKDNGIPETPTAYDLKDLAVPEGDKEIVNGFLAKLHKANATPDVAREAIRSYYEEQARQVETRQKQDETQRQTALDALNQEWGGQFRRNLNMMTGLLSKFPESIREGLKSARLPDGSLLFNNVDAVRGLTALAFEINPAGIIAPAGSGDIQKGAMDEYNDIRKLMREERSTYNKDAVKQARLVELIEYLAKNELIDAQGNPVVQKKAA